MALIPKSTAYTRMFKMIDSSDHISKKTGLTCTVNLSKAGGSFGAAGGTVTEVANGWYKIALNTTDTNIAGDLAYYITAAHIGPGGPDDPPGVSVFYVDHNVVTSTFQGQTQTVVDDPEFLGDSGIPSDPGHYSFHPAAGVAGEVQVAYRPAK